MAIFAIGMWSLHGAWFASGFDSVMGDLGDARISVSIMEHWFGVFSGAATVALKSPSYFYPVTGTLGFTDTYFLFSIPYALCRVLGFDLYASFMGSILTFSTIGFWSFFALARRWLNSSPIVAATGAFLFAFPSMLIVKSPHCQTLCAMLLPAIIMLVASGLTSGSRVGGLAKMSLAGALHGLILFTAFQTGWFFTFVILLAATIYLFLAHRQSRTKTLLALVWKKRQRIAAYVISLAIALVPFVVVYGPLVLAGEKFPLEIHRFYAPRFYDIINTTSNNLVWGKLLAATRISTSLNPELISEVALGYGIATFAAWFGFSIVLLHRVRKHPKAFQQNDLYLVAIGLALIGLWLMQLRWFNLWPWKIIYGVVPGASAIRVTVRSQIVVNLGAAILVSVLLDRLIRHRTLAAKAAVAVLVPLLIAEQFTDRHSVFSRRDELAWIDKLPAPPPGCSRFYIVPQPTESKKFWMLAQSDSMIAAQTLRLPTINGHSSRFPPGWDMLDPYKPGYAEAVRTWVARYNIADGMCGLDPRVGLWRNGLP